MVQGRDNIVLDIGCGEGETGYELKRQGKAKEVICIELAEEAARNAKNKLDRVLVGDIEKLELPFAKEYFDYILMGDVLEHLIDPWSCLKRLKEYLKPGGSVIASIPNVNHWRVLNDLILHDRWEYIHAGTLDRTHLRFFTKKTIVRMFSEYGYKIIYLGKNYSARLDVRLFDRLTLRRLERFLAVQYVVIGRKE